MSAVRAQIVVPVHSLDRPIRRSTESILKCRQAGVLVVAHGVDPKSLDLPESERLTVVQVADEIGLPGVPFNRGLDQTSAPWVGVMGSDDWYEDGAIEAMLDHLTKDRADGIIAPLRYAGKDENEITPTTWRRRNLRPGRDRMFFRTAPLGLFRGEIMRDSAYQFNEGSPAGTDVVNGAVLWSSGFSVSYYPEDPAYVVGDDAVTRVTRVARALSVHAAEWRNLWFDPNIRQLSGRDRKALANKMMIQHVLPLVSAWSDAERWGEGDFEWLVGTARQLVEEVPSLPGTINRAKRPVLEALLTGDFEATLKAEKASTTAPYIDWRLASNPLRELGVTSSRRRVLASKLSRWRSERGQSS